MKPLYIRMQAFGSYQQAEIDFTQIPGGLFLITGDTGAGKTTIFDAITFALFDETSGGRRSGEMMRSQYARQDLITEVEFRFLYYDQIYTIIRRPKQDKFKAKTSENGTVVYEKNKTPLGPDVEFILPDGTSYPGKKTETDKKIREIIGLDAAQFTQIAMLAQGDFMKLLQASSKERMEIFAKIFDTRIYQYIEQELMNRTKESNIALKRNEEVIHLELQRLRLMENSAYGDVFEEQNRFRASAKADEVLDFIGKLIGEAEEQQSILKEQEKQNALKLEELRTALNNAEAFNNTWDKYQGFIQIRNSLQVQAEAMKQLQEKQNLGKKANLVKQKEQLFEERKKETEDCRLTLEEIRAAIAGLETDCKTQTVAASEKQAEYERQQPLFSAEIARIESMYPQYRVYEEALLQKEQREKTCAELEVRQTAAETLLREKTEQKQSLSQRKTELEQNIEHVAVLEAEIQKQQELAGELGGLANAMETLENARIEGKKLRQVSNSAKHELEQQEEQYNRLYQQFLESQASILARGLKEGEPCPVCGSRHHEPVVHTNMEIVESDMLKAAQSRLDMARKRDQKAGEDVTRAVSEYRVRELDVLKNGRKYYDASFQLDTVSRQDVEERRRLAAGMLSQLQSRKTVAEQQQKELKDCTEALASLEEQIQQSTVAVHDAIRALQEEKIALAGYITTVESLKQQLSYESEQAAHNAADNLSRELQQMKNGWEIENQRLQQIRGILQEKQGAMQTQQNLLESLSGKQDIAYEQFVKAMQEQDFASEGDYRDALLPAEELNRVDETLHQYEQQMQENNAQIRTIEDDVKGKARQDTGSLQEKLKALQVQLEQNRQAETRLYSLLENNRNVQENIRGFYQNRDAMLKENSILRNLDATANGKLSGKHLKFQTYIQRRYFKQIVDNANKRLYVMSGSQFILQCRDTDALGSQGFVGLDLDVYSIVNDQTRDVKTLSGGESFMAALALALGMADMIQHTASSVHIDTMFIDEGFGSLSEETRNQAIAILNQLSGGKRLVGIISHVTELKNQIDRKLIVTKTEKGSKAAWEVL